MNAPLLLSRLDHVRKYGNGWRADCPNGHTKARGSLSIMEADDGRILLHCFACNDTRGILTSLGLELADLYPERIKDPSPAGRKAAREAFKRHSWGLPWACWRVRPSWWKLQPMTWSAVSRCPMLTMPGC